MTNPHPDNSESKAPFKVILVINAFEDDAPTRVMLNVGEALASSGLYECAVAAWSRRGPLRSWAEEKVGRTYVLSSSEEGLGTFAPPGLRFVRLLNAGSSHACSFFPYEADPLKVSRSPRHLRFPGL